MGSIKSGWIIDLRLFATLLRPSWLSGLLTLSISLIVVMGTITLTRIGGGIAQSIFGLGHIYTQSSLSDTTRAVTHTLSSSQLINNILLFLLWSAFGLVIYSVSEGILREFHSTDELVHELHYVNSNRWGTIANIGLRAAIRLAAVAALAIFSRSVLHHVIPYTIATAHITALHSRSASDWLSCTYATLLCIASFHCLLIFARLLFLRPRLIHSQAIDA